MIGNIVKRDQPNKSRQLILLIGPNLVLVFRVPEPNSHMGRVQYSNIGYFNWAVRECIIIGLSMRKVRTGTIHVCPGVLSGPSTNHI